jgi:hypothetical protein
MTNDPNIAASAATPAPIGEAFEAELASLVRALEQSTRDIHRPDKRRLFRDEYPCEPSN